MLQLFVICCKLFLLIYLILKKWCLFSTLLFWPFNTVVVSLVHSLLLVHYKILTFLLVNFDFGINLICQRIVFVLIWTSIKILILFLKLIAFSFVFCGENVLIVVVPPLLRQMRMILWFDISFLLLFFTSILSVEVCFHPSAPHLYPIFTLMLLFHLFI